MAGPFRVGLTRDCLGDDGTTPIFDPAALGRLAGTPGLDFEFIGTEAPEVTQEEAGRYDAIVVLKPRVTARTLAGPQRRLMLVARMGVGYDNVDVAACTAAGVALTITPDGVRRPVATVILTFILALAQKLLIKDKLTRSGRWSERTRHMGDGLTGKTVGSIGLGNIGREAFRLLRPLEMRHLACDPVAQPAVAAELGVELVDLETLLRRADFVCVNCPLSAATHHLVGVRELALMKPSAYLINTARGPIVDEAALYAALIEKRIAGAALDVFEIEPTPPDNPILGLENVIATPHALCWTDECFRRMAEDAFAAVVAMARGDAPAHVVNRAVLDHPALKAALAARRGKG